VVRPSSPAPESCGVTLERFETFVTRLSVDAPSFAAELLRDGVGESAVLDGLRIFDTDDARLDVVSLVFATTTGEGVHATPVLLD
jgi:hypothetical protein